MRCASAGFGIMKDGSGTGVSLRKEGCGTALFIDDVESDRDNAPVPVTAGVALERE